MLQRAPYLHFMAMNCCQELAPNQSSQIVYSHYLRWDMDQAFEFNKDCSCQEAGKIKLYTRIQGWKETDNNVSPKWPSGWRSMNRKRRYALAYPQRRRAITRVWSYPHISSKSMSALARSLGKTNKAALLDNQHSHIPSFDANDWVGKASIVKMLSLVKCREWEEWEWRWFLGWGRGHWYSGGMKWCCREWFWKWRPR